MTATSESGHTEAVASIEHRVDAVESILHERGLEPAAFIDDAEHLIEDAWVPTNGARIVAKAWADAGFRERLLVNGRDAVLALGYAMPRHHRQLVVLENTAAVHNVVCCTLCSCTPFTIVGLPPDWYKELAYRSRVVRESRTVLREMGLALPPDTEVRVWDTTADTRYMVLPLQPRETIGWAEDKLAAIVTRDGMFGAAPL